MLFHLLAFTLFCIILDVQSHAGIKPCKTDDQVCLIELGNAIYKEFVIGRPSANVESVDPLHLEWIEAKLNNLNYNYTNADFKGFKDCTIHNLNIDWSKSHLRFEVTCPHLVMTATYNINGRLLILPIEGHGPCTIHVKDYKFAINSDFKKKTENGKAFLVLRNLKLDVLSRGHAQYDFKNMFNGQSDLANGIHKFAQDNWRDIANEFEGPVWAAVVKKVIGILNNFFKIVPMDEVFLS